MRTSLFAKIVLVILIGATVLLLCSSCGASWKLRRADKLINQAINSGAQIKRDTVYKDKIVNVPGPHTTVTTPGIDRIVKRDTTIYQDRIKIRELFRHDTLRIFVECPDSVMHVKEAVAVTEQIICPPRSNFWKYIALALGCVVVLLAFLLRR